MNLYLQVVILACERKNNNILNNLLQTLNEWGYDETQNDFK